MHLATEWLDQGEEDDPTIAWSKAFELGIEQARERWPDEAEWIAAGFTEAKKQRREHWSGKGQAYVQQWWERESPPSVETTLVEVDVSASLPSGLKIKAYVDRIYVDADDGAEIVDLKTGSKRPESDQQLGIYRVLVEKKFPQLTVVKTGNYMFKDDKTHDLDTSNWTLDVVDTVAQAWVEAIDNGTFIPKRTNGCNTCSMQLACYLQSGDTETTRKFDPLNPFYENPPKEFLA